MIWAIDFERDKKWEEIEQPNKLKQQKTTTGDPLTEAVSLGTDF